MNDLFQKPESDPIPRLLLRPAEAALACSVSERTMVDWMKKPGFPSVKIRGCRLINVDRLRTWCDNQVDDQEGGGGDE